jgi:hypothetical protein
MNFDCLQVQEANQKQETEEKKMINRVYYGFCTKDESGRRLQEPNNK